MTESNAVRKPEPDADAWLSALYDGELEGDAAKHAHARLGREPDAANRWAEYSLIGDALRGCQAGSADFRQRVRAALADEPTVLAPMPAAPPAHRPYYWAAAAAAVAAIAWSVLSVAPQAGIEHGVPVAANDPAGGAVAPSDEVRAYLAAHQDYAYAVVGDPEMQFTSVSLAGERR